MQVYWFSTTNGTSGFVAARNASEAFGLVDAASLQYCEDLKLLTEERNRLEFGTQVFTQPGVIKFTTYEC